MTRGGGVDNTLYNIRDTGRSLIIEVARVALATCGINVTKYLYYGLPAM